VLLHFISPFQCICWELSILCSVVFVCMLISGLRLSDLNKLLTCLLTCLITVITRLPSKLRPTTHECVHFRPRHKDGGHTIRSAISENPMLHADSTILQNRSYCRQKFYMLKYGFLLQRPWPWPDDLHTRTWLVSREDITQTKHKLSTSRLSKIIVLHINRHAYELMSPNTLPRRLAVGDNLTVTYGPYPSALEISIIKRYINSPSLVFFSL